MKNKIKIRYQEVADAEIFYKILINPKFIYFSAKPESVEDEIKFLEGNEDKRKRNFEHNFTVLFNAKVIGGCGVKIDQHRPYIGEIGYFIDEAYWNKGITTEAVNLLEEFVFEKLNLKRIEIFMLLENKASEKVAVKSGYLKEGIAKNKILHNGKYMDCYVYAKSKCI